MRVLFLLALAFGASVCYSAPSRQQIERDLALVAKIRAASPFDTTEPIQVDVWIENRSETDTYPLVKPGDGSEVGWREPFVFYTAEAKSGNGKWRTIKQASLLRCGNYDSDWQKDVVQLAPGQKLTIGGGIPTPNAMLEFHDGEQIRLQVHYAYRQGRGIRTSGEGSKVDTRQMGDTPAFELVSAPVEFAIHDDFALIVTPRRSIKAGTTADLSELVDVVLENRTAEPTSVLLAISTLNPLTFNMKTEERGSLGVTNIKRTANASERMPDTAAMAPGKTVDLLRTAKSLWHVEAKSADRIWIQAQYKWVRQMGPMPVVLSPWVEIKVER